MPFSSETPERGATLTSRQREVLRLQAYGLSYDEISAHLGLSVWTVKNHHKQAVRSLQQSLTIYPSDRIRTSLACYILGLLDGGVPALEIVERLKEAKVKHPSRIVTDGVRPLDDIESGDEDLV